MSSLEEDSIGTYKDQGPLSKDDIIQVVIVIIQYTIYISVSIEQRPYSISELGLTNTVCFAPVFLD